jgi:hypothetical protein
MTGDVQGVLLHAILSLEVFYLGLMLFSPLVVLEYPN